MAYTIGALAELIQADVVGDASVNITHVGTLHSAKKGGLAFLASAAYRDALKITSASVVVIEQAEQEAVSSLLPCSALVCRNVRYAMVKIIEAIHPEKIQPPSVHPKAVIHPTATIGENTSIGAGAVIGEGVIIGKNCRIDSGAIIGSEGFGFAQQDGKWFRIPHIGSVVIGDNVELGANTTIDRGILENTQIESGVIIDNLVQIAHNVVIGEPTAIAGCVGISGSTKIGKRCLIGGGAGIAGHLTIVDDVHITGTTAVHKSLLTPGVYSSGFPVEPTSTWKRGLVHYKNLDKWVRRLKMLEKNL